MQAQVNPPWSQRFEQLLYWSADAGLEAAKTAAHHWETAFQNKFKDEMMRLNKDAQYMTGVTVTIVKPADESNNGADIKISWVTREGPRAIWLQIKSLYKNYSTYLEKAHDAREPEPGVQTKMDKFDKKEDQSSIVFKDGKITFGVDPAPYFDAFYRSKRSQKFQAAAMQQTVENAAPGSLEAAGYLIFNRVAGAESVKVLPLAAFATILSKGGSARVTEDLMLQEPNRQAPKAMWAAATPVEKLSNWIPESGQ